LRKERKRPVGRRARLQECAKGKKGRLKRRRSDRKEKTVDLKLEMGRAEFQKKGEVRDNPRPHLKKPIGASDTSMKSEKASNKGRGLQKGGSESTSTKSEKFVSATKEVPYVGRKTRIRQLKPIHAIGRTLQCTWKVTQKWDNLKKDGKGKPSV